MSEYTIINGELYHHGIKGQKWGVRRYQNPDGTLTPAGKKKKQKEEFKKDKRAYKKTYFKRGRTFEVEDERTGNKHQIYVSKSDDFVSDLAVKKGQDYANKVRQSADYEMFVGPFVAMYGAAFAAAGAVYVADKLKKM